MCSSKAESKELILQRQRGRPAGLYGEYRKVRIGADLEFELHKNGKFFPAYKVFHGLNTPIGVDGSRDTGELRPCLTSGGTGEYLFYQVKGTHNAPDSQGLSQLLVRVARTLDETFEVWAGSGPTRPLGGHLHFSGVAKDAVFLSALDRLIAIPLNEVSNNQHRISCGYGYLGVTKVGKPHGGFEYRSPLSWISTPVVARGVVSLAWLLAQAQKHGSLAQFQTLEDFFEYPRKGHAKNIRKFTDTLHDLKQRSIKLEDIEVLKAWDLRHLLKPVKKPRRNKKKPIPVEWSLGDSYLPAIAERVGELLSPIELRIVGAHQSRSQAKVVFLPAGWWVDLSSFTNIAFQHWNSPCVGLSWSLRDDVPLAAQVVRQIVASVRTSMR